MAVVMEGMIRTALDPPLLHPLQEEQEEQEQEQEEQGQEEQEQGGWRDREAGEVLQLVAGLQVVVVGLL
jgi:hypothetical protein